MLGSDELGAINAQCCYGSCRSLGCQCTREMPTGDCSLTQAWECGNPSGHYLRVRVGYSGDYPATDPSVRERPLGSLPPGPGHLRPGT